VKRGRGEYIRTPPVTAFGGDSPLINAGAKGGVAANSTINCNLYFLWCSGWIMFRILHKNPTFGTFCLHFFEEIDFFHNFFVDFLNTMTYNREATVKKEGLYAEYRIGGTGDPPELR
jgi:hypothetical protein